jgi:glutamyl-tRNA(Gln) amidotransferase subunit D
MTLKDFMKKNNFENGTIIGFEFGNKFIEGTVIPSRDNILMLKLDSGYNAGFDFKKIKNLKIFGKSKGVGKPANILIEKNPKLETISILHTGGTIASRVNYSKGGVIASFEINDLITLFPELLKIANLNSVFVRNMMSEDMSFIDYEAMGKAIEKEIKKGVKGIIIGHGTDTLGYSSAALSFVMENCPIPIILVGSQRSSDRGSSDAAMNLICAATFITKTNFAGVAVCMHNSMNDDYCAILPGTKVRKMHTSRRDAFKAINDTPIALVNYNTKQIDWIKNKNDFLKQKKFKMRNNFEKKTGLLKMHPGISKKILEFYRKQKYKGLIIEGTGLGHTPLEKDDSFIKEIGKLVKSGCVVGMTSQCLHGRVHSTVYTNLRKVLGQGVIYCEDMLPETAYIKLSWLLANYKKCDVENMLPENLRGEITKYSRIDTFNNWDSNYN